MDVQNLEWPTEMSKGKGSTVLICTVQLLFRGMLILKQKGGYSAEEENVKFKVSNTHHNCGSRTENAA
jgi:hypothetical protein